MKDFVKLLGVRGSVPVSGPEFMRYGGATACVELQLGSQHILLDAGTGLQSFRAPQNGKPQVILLSHLHLDHIIGLLTHTLLFQPTGPVYVLAPAGKLSLYQALDKLADNGLWPSVTEFISPQAMIQKWPGPAQHFGGVFVETMPGNHPGGTLIYKLTHMNKSIVYATDFEHSPDASARLAWFAGDCDLLLYDAQYSDEEYERKRGWGHSTWQEAVKIAQACRAKKTVLIHHDPMHTDWQLDALGLELAQHMDTVHIGREGEVIEL